MVKVDCTKNPVLSEASAYSPDVTLIPPVGSILTGLNEADVSEIAVVLTVEMVVPVMVVLRRRSAARLDEHPRRWYPLRYNRELVELIRHMSYGRQPSRRGDPPDRHFTEMIPN